MESRIMRVFYGKDVLPYKDKERTIHYPVVGNAFNGANNTTQIRFYVKDIGGITGVQWIVMSKLPNGQIANKVLNNADAVYDEEAGEYYLPFDLSAYYTSLKGEVFLSLNGYLGGVLVDYDDDEDVYEIHGTPIVQATGVIKIAINYAPQVIPGTFEPGYDTLQQLLGALSDKLETNDGIFVYSDPSLLDLASFNEGQVFYNKVAKQFYVLNYGQLSKLTDYASEDYAYSKAESDTLLSGKVDKTNQASKLYGTDSDGNQAIIPVEDETGDVARRDNSGQLVVPLTPSYNGNATSKKYVDDLITTVNASIASSGHSLYLDTSDYKLYLKDANGNNLNYVDLPLESIVVSATYYATYTYDGTTYTNVLVIVLATTSVPTIVPLGDLVSGLVSTGDLATALSGYYTKLESDSRYLIKSSGAGTQNVSNDIEMIGSIDFDTDYHGGYLKFDDTYREYISDVDGTFNFEIKQNNNYESCYQISEDHGNVIFYLYCDEFGGSTTLAYFSELDTDTWAKSNGTHPLSHDNVYAVVPSSTPSSSGTFTPKSVNGTPTWCEEWVGTQTQYDNLGTYDANTTYYIIEE